MLLTAPLLVACNEDHQWVEVITKQPTCTEPGEGHLECPEDGAYTNTKEIPALGHKEATRTIAPTCTEDGYMSHYCTRCGVELYRDHIVEAHGHHFVSDSVSPTCTTSGHSENYCEYCGLEEYEPYDIDPLGHKFIYQETVSPTCVIKGYDLYECERCHVTKRDNYVDALGHDVSITDSIEPTCLEFGKSIYTCSRPGCNYYHVELNPEVKPLGHDYISHEAVSPDCTHEGHHIYHTCSRCDYSDLNEKTIDALGHKYDKIVTPATCEEPGYTTFICHVCGDTYIGEETPAKGHALIHHEGLNATCDAIGYKPYVTCSECDYSTYEEIPAVGGEHEYTEEVVNPTTSTKGYTLHTCSKCGISYKTDFTNPISAFRNTKADDYLDRHSDMEAVNKWRDDDTYFYILYQGHVEDYPLHTYVSLIWNDEIKYLGSYPKTIEQALQMDVLDTHMKNQALLNENTASKLNVGGVIDSSGGIRKSNSSAFDEIFKEAWPIDSISMPVELNDPSMDAVTKKINSITSEYQPGENFNLYENDEHYYYAAVVDVDLYLGITYDLASHEVSYKPYTVFNTSNIEEKLFCSTNDIYACGSPMDIATKTSKNLEKPTNYKTNHPSQYLNWQFYRTGGDGNLNVKAGHTEEIVVHNDLIKEYTEKGYNRAKIVINWEYNTSWWASDHSILFQIGFNASQYLIYFENDHSKYVEENGSIWRKYDNGGYSNHPINIITFYADTVLFGSASEIILRWRNTATLDRGPYDISVTMYFFNESAYYDGAYGTGFPGYKTDIPTFI